MKKRSLMVRGLVLAGALVFASSVASRASGAPAKHKKPGKKPVPAAASAPTSVDEPKPPTDALVPVASDPAPVAPADTPKPSEAPKVEADVSSLPDAKTSLEAASETAGPSDHELEALGRREAARVAAGRIEVAVWVAAEVGRRTFKYSDPVGQQYAPYRLPLAPMISMGLEAYPFASSDVPGLRDLGFRARFSKAFAVDSQTPEGATIDTSWTRFGAEVRQRLLFPSAHPLELGVAIGADASYFDMSTKSVVSGLLPSARTLSVRLGLDGRLQLVPRFALALGVAYLAPTTRGAIYNRFRDPHVHGVDGDFAAVLGIVPGLEARAAARYTRYFASFEPVLGDALVAGGALDEQLQFGVGVRYAH
ncbi:MAG: hypothetical protein ABW061_13725 [Polyangiaceae bacterium]